MARDYKIKFGAREAVLLGIIKVTILLSNITFHVLFTNTLFLFYFQNINRINIKLNNFKNVLIQNNKIVLIIRK